MPTEQFCVLVFPGADRKLSTHITFLAAVSESAAMRLYESYEEALKFLADIPKSCSLYEPKLPITVELRYKLFAERYRMVFEIVDNTVYVYDIQDCRQDSDKNFI